MLYAVPYVAFGLCRLNRGKCIPPQLRVYYAFLASRARSSPLKLFQTRAITHFPSSQAIPLLHVLIWLQAPGPQPSTPPSAPPSGVPITQGSSPSATFLHLRLYRPPLFFPPLPGSAIGSTNTPTNALSSSTSTGATVAPTGGGGEGDRYSTRPRRATRRRRLRGVVGPAEEEGVGEGSIRRLARRIQGIVMARMVCYSSSSLILALSSLPRSSSHLLPLYRDVKLIQFRSDVNDLQQKEMVAPRRDERPDVRRSVGGGGMLRTVGGGVGAGGSEWSSFFSPFFFRLNMNCERRLGTGVRGVRCDVDGD
jgi:hypothetical protein